MHVLPRLSIGAPHLQTCAQNNASQRQACLPTAHARLLPRHDHWPQTPGQAAPDGNPFPFNIAVLGEHALCDEEVGICKLLCNNGGQQLQHAWQTRQLPELLHNDGAKTNHTHAGDPGQTYNTSKTLTHIMHAWGLDPAKRRQWNRGGLDLVFFTGDYT
jgi:hypothetical protein